MGGNGRVRRLLHDWRVGVVVVLVWGAVVVVGVRGADASRGYRGYGVTTTLAIDALVPGSRSYSRSCHIWLPQVGVVQRGDDLVVMSDWEPLVGRAELGSIREFQFLSDLFRSKAEAEGTSSDFGEVLASGIISSRTSRLGAFAPSIAIRRDQVSVTMRGGGNLTPEIEYMLAACLGPQFVADKDSDGCYRLTRTGIKILWVGLFVDSTGLATTAWMPLAVSVVVRRVRRRRTGGCGGCGYDLRGLPTEVCPECGRDVAGS